jgi:polysaccharide deacetylase family protein (PEP-CTERM system associated)
MTAPPARTGAAPAASAGPVVNMMTIDVEDYFHVSALAAAAPRDRWESFESRVSANTDRLLEAFAQAGVRATFFVLGWVADRHPDLVRRILAAGHELASHGFHHQLVYDLTPEEFGSDIRRSKDVLEQIAGRPVVGYRAPSYSITRKSLWALDVLVAEGFKYDASIFPVHHDRYGIPDAPRHAYRLTQRDGHLIEIPPSTVRLGGVNFPVAGGGYFRLLPYWWTAAGIGRVNRHEQRPVCFYLHPWEVDPDQPRLPASRLSTFRHYRNLHLTEPRLKRLLAAFPFAAVEDVMTTIDVPDAVPGSTGATPAPSPV